MALDCLEWLESQPAKGKKAVEKGCEVEKGGVGYRVDEILGLAKYLPEDIVEEFLFTRPHLSWLYHTQRKVVCHLIVLIYVL